MKPTTASSDPLVSAHGASPLPPQPDGQTAARAAPDGSPSGGATPEEDASEEAEQRRETREVIAALGTGIVDRSLVTVLQHVQERLGFLPRAAMLEVAEQLSLPPAQVYGVATFYNQFRFNPPGRRAIKVCMGTACAIKQGGTILESWERRLGISEGETTEDREYSLERVACVGCCSLAPVVLVNEEVRAHMTPTAVDGILLQHQIQQEKADTAAANAAAADADAAAQSAADAKEPTP